MKPDLKAKKDNLRKEIAKSKKTLTTEELLVRSDEVFSVLEITGQFRDAKHIFIYNSMADEVSTSAFIDKWKHEKCFYLPVVTSGGLIFRKLADDTVFEQSPIGVNEPLGSDFTEYNKVDMIIVPGVAFDRKSNRLGRGKGYYDQFLPKLKCPKIGVCFDFQLLDQVPADDRDVKMDMIVSENDLIW